MAFDPDKYLAETESTTPVESSSFDPDAYLAESEPVRDIASLATEDQKPQEDISTARAALVGAGQGVSAGFAEEITAPFAAAAGMISGLPSESPEESTYDKFKRLMDLYRETAREEQKAAQEQAPIAYTAGLAGGSLLSPGLGAAKAAKAVKDAGFIAKTAVGSATGAGLGALAGAGEAEGTIPERLEGAKEGAKIGAIGGAAVPIAGAGLGLLKSGAGLIGKAPWVQDITKSFSRGVKGEALATSAGRREASTSLREVGGGLFKDVKSLEKKYGKAIGEEIKAAQEAGEMVDLNEEIPTIFNKLTQIEREGSKEAAAYASSIKSEINKILGIKPQVVDDTFMGVKSLDLPEGITVPKVAQEAPDYLVTPEAAQDIKQVMSRYVPKKGIEPQKVEAAQVAAELKDITSGKIEEISEQIPELSKSYGITKDIQSKLFKVKAKDTPREAQNKVNAVIRRIEKENITGDDARETLESLTSYLTDLGEDGQKILQQYSPKIQDLTERLSLSEKIVKGGETFTLAGTPKAMAMAASNIAGLGAKKTGIAKVSSLAGQAVKQAATSPDVQRSILMSQIQSGENLKKIQEPYERYKLATKIVEKATPDILVAQANQIRQQYGTSGQQLANILENMSKENANSRNALMYTIMQNPAYRQMLGLGGNVENE